MKGKITNYEGYVLKVSDYKDNDAVVTFLSKDGILVFSAKGIKKPTSKNRSSISLLSKSRVSILEVGDKKLLTESSTLTSPKINDDYLLSVCLMFISELNNKIIDGIDEEAFEWLDALMKNLNAGISNPLTQVSIYFAQILRILGYGLEVDKCVICGKKKDIIGISISDGGFICREDLEYENQKKDPYFLKMIRFSFKCKPQDMQRVKFENKDALSLIRYLANFYEENTGDKIRSVDYFSKI